MRQTDEQKLERSIAILEELKDARGGKLLDSHRVMGNDPNLINMFLQQYVNCNKKDISIHVFYFIHESVYPKISANLSRAVTHHLKEVGVFSTEIKNRIISVLSLQISQCI